MPFPSEESARYKQRHSLTAVIRSALHHGVPFRQAPQRARQNRRRATGRESRSDRDPVVPRTARRRLALLERQQIDAARGAEGARLRPSVE